MKRRAALATSAALSVAILGGTVAAAAMSGGGFLGFQSGASQDDALPASSVTTTEVPGTQGTTPTTQAPIVVKVVEDRIVVTTSSPVMPGETVAPSGLRPASVGTADTAGANGSQPAAATVPASTTVSKPRPHDDDDEHEDEAVEHEDGEHGDGDD